MACKICILQLISVRSTIVSKIVYLSDISAAWVVMDHIENLNFFFPLSKICRKTEEKEKTEETLKKSQYKILYDYKSKPIKMNR